MARLSSFLVFGLLACDAPDRLYGPRNDAGGSAGMAGSGGSAGDDGAAQAGAGPGQAGAAGSAGAGAGSGQAGAAGSAGMGAGEQVCVPAQVTCIERTPARCNAEGTGYSMGTECAADQTCVDGACTDLECAPLELFCQGLDVRRCADDGLGSSVETTCVNQACVVSEGEPSCSGVCAPGQARCSGNAVQTCDDNGQWGDAASCPSAEPHCASGACGAPRSCSELAPTCGASADESCCDSPVVQGGSFDRLNDANYPTTVSSFRLDKFEVSVGRFRRFLAAVVGGWHPQPASGRHTHLRSGSGLANSGNLGREEGWDPAWNAQLHADLETWSGGAALGCSPAYATWTAEPGDNEKHPINCVNWYQAYAFCIWDGGFLPTDTEWNYAAVGGSQQHEYPWGAEAPEFDATLAVYGCFYQGSGPGGCTGVRNIAPVGSVPAGDGHFGQSDLLGNLYEWALDAHTTSITADCTDCAHLPLDATDRTLNGGSYTAFATSLPSLRNAADATERTSTWGIRCARPE